MSEYKTWVESRLKRELTEFQRECVLLLADGMNTGVYNIDCNWEKVNWMPGDYGVIFVVSHSDWSTYDFDRLTRLVIAAHDRCIRVSLQPCAPHRMRILMHRREREGMISQRHPTIEQAIERYRGE